MPIRKHPNSAPCGAILDPAPYDACAWKARPNSRIVSAIACTCGSLSGLVGAVLGGLGIGAQSARLRSEGTVAVGPEAGLPPLGETEFVVVPALGRPSAPVQAMADTILEFGRAFHAEAL